MIKNTYLSLEKISRALLLYLVAFAIAYACSMFYLYSQFSSLEETWQDYRSQSNEKARLQQSLYSSLGFGGVIHNFKNYVLRQDYDTFVKLERSLGAANTIVNQYSDLSTSTAEKIALEDVKSVLNLYKSNVSVINDGIEEGLNSSAIDEKVRIDDSLAIRGLQVLSQEIESKYPFFGNSANRPVLKMDMRKIIGFGGMVHHYKNYILRGDAEHKRKTSEAIEKLRTKLTTLANDSTNAGELVALNDISSTLDLYEYHLETIEKELSINTSAEDIDKLVVIDDSLALRGFSILDRANVAALDKKSEIFNRTFDDIVKYEKMTGFIISFLVIILATAIYHIFSKYVINPIKTISVIMEELANGNLDVIKEHSEEKIRASTELGRMEQALRVFKEKEIERRAGEEKIRQLALHDPLTGLANRNYFDTKYRELEMLAEKENQHLFLLALDLDNFKPINDEFGHAAGDVVLEKVASRLTSTFRENDIIARTGGDEFLVAIYGPEKLNSVIKLANRLLEVIPSPIPFGRDILSVGVSIGIAESSPKYRSTIDLMTKHADEALYQAKHVGKNTYQVYETRGKVAFPSR